MPTQTSNYQHEKGICKNCGKETEEQICLYEMAELNGKPTLFEKPLYMCSEKCCKEYIKKYESRLSVKGGK